MLTARQEAIKMYVKNAHKQNRPPTVKEIADAFETTSGVVRDELTAIRKDRKKNHDIMDVFNNIFGGTI